MPVFPPRGLGRPNFFPPRSLHSVTRCRAPGPIPACRRSEPRSANQLVLHVYEAFWKAARCLQDGRVFPTREPNVDPLAGPESLVFGPARQVGATQQKGKALGLPHHPFGAPRLLFGFRWHTLAE